jgi:hypothetical protein
MTVRSVPHCPRWALAACLAVGCGSSSAPAPSSPPPQVFAGQVAGTDARVAVVATTHHARVYFCGGPSSYETSTHWFLASIDASGQIDAAMGADGGLSFTAQIADGGVQGTLVAVDGAAHPFTASPVAPTTIAGLYEAEGPCGKVGVIVTQPSAAADPAVQGACIGSPGANGATPVEQVTPLLPVVRAADGTLRVTVVGTAGEVLVAPAAAPAP